MSGKVIVDGHYSTRKYGVSELSKRVGLLQQNPDLQLFLPSVEEEIVFGACNYGIPAEDIRKHVEQLLALTHLTPFRQKILTSSQEDKNRAVRWPQSSRLNQTSSFWMNQPLILIRWVVAISCT